MKFYKHDNGVAIYEAREIELKTSDTCVEITEEEYNAAVQEINERVMREYNNGITIEIPYIRQLEARNAELEAENAALLFQNLTGEEFII